MSWLNQARESPSFTVHYVFLLLIPLLPLPSRCLPRKKGLWRFCADRVLSSFKWWITEAKSILRRRETMIEVRLEYGTRTRWFGFESNETESTISFDIGLARQPPLYGTQGGSSLSSYFSWLAIHSQKTLFSFDSVAEGWVLPWVVFDRLTGKLSLGDRCKRRWSCCWPSLDLTPGSRNAQSGFPLIPTNQGCKCVLLAIQNGLPPFGKLNAPIGHEAFLVILDCVSGLWSTSLAETKSVREEARGRSLRLIRIEFNDSPREGVLLQLQFTMALRWRSDTFPDMASRTISLFCVWMPIGEFEWNILRWRWFPFSFVLLVSNMAVSLQWNWRVRESQFAYGALHSESMDCFWEPSSDPIQNKKEGIWRHNKRLMPWKSAKDSKRGWFGFLCKKKMLSKLTSYTEHRNKLRLSQGPTLFHQENSSIPQSPYTGWSSSIPSSLLVEKLHALLLFW